jgi:hypothetical protein
VPQRDAIDKVWIAAFNLSDDPPDYRPGCWPSGSVPWNQPDQRKSTRRDDNPRGLDGSSRFHNIHQNLDGSFFTCYQPLA